MKRQAQKNFDTFSVQSNIYNEKAGAQKNMHVGARLLPICLENSTFTTNATAPINVGFGKQIAIYNNSGLLATARIGSDSSVTAGVAGSIDANSEASIPLKPNDWTYIATGDKNYIVTSAATALVYIIDDDTLMVNS